MSVESRHIKLFFRLLSTNMRLHMAISKKKSKKTCSLIELIKTLSHCLSNWLQAISFMGRDFFFYNVRLFLEGEEQIKENLVFFLVFHSIHSQTCLALVETIKTKRRKRKHRVAVIERRVKQSLRLSDLRARIDQLAWMRRFVRISDLTNFSSEFIWDLTFDLVLIILSGNYSDENW